MERDIIEDEEKYDEDSNKRKRPQIHSSYVALLSDIIDVDPSNYEEVAEEKWKKTMIKEYQFIMGNDV